MKEIKLQENGLLAKNQIKLSKTDVNKELSQLNRINTNNLLNNTTNNKYLTNININNTSFINDVGIYDEVISNKSIDTIRDAECFDDNITTDIRAQFPLFFINRNIIKIPTKVRTTIERFIPKELLIEIHSDRDVAIELCLMFTTQLTSTYFEIQDNPESEGWKSLHAKYLREFLSINPNTYKDVRTALEHHTKQGPIIECDHKHIEGEKNYYYRFGEAYIAKGMVSYHLKTKEAKRLLNKHFIRVYKRSQSNPIIQNLLGFYEDARMVYIKERRKQYPIPNRPGAINSFLK